MERRVIRGVTNHRMIPFIGPGVKCHNYFGLNYSLVWLLPFPPSPLWFGYAKILPGAFRPIMVGISIHPKVQILGRWVILADVTKGGILA